jgi:hypothetical protein
MFFKTVKASSKITVYLLFYTISVSFPQTSHKHSILQTCTIQASLFTRCMALSMLFYLSLLYFPHLSISQGCFED